MPDITGVSHIALTVRDLDTSLAWYERVLGVTDNIQLEMFCMPS